MAERPGSPGVPHEAGEDLRKIAICVPTRGWNPSGFTTDLAWLTAYSVERVNARIGLLFGEHTYVQRNQNDLAAAALQASAGWMLWLGDDMRFPKDTLVRLLAHNVPIVGANYVSRRAPVRPVAVKSGDARLYTMPESTGLEEVMAVGFGVVLVRADVFGALQYPWFENYFDREHKRWVGEDVDFCNKARAVGFKVLVDHDLSQEVQHTGALDFTHEHAEQEVASGDQAVQRTQDGGGELAGPDRPHESDTGVHSARGGLALTK